MIPVLRAFSSFSFGRGVLSPAQLCELAAQRAVTHLALVDVGGLYGLVEFLAAARQRGLAAVVGATLALPDGEFTLLAQGREGYVSLVRLLTAAHAAGMPALHRLSPPSHVAVLVDDPAALRAAVAWVGPSSVYAAWGPGGTAASLLREAARHGVACVVAPRVFLAEPGQYEVHRLQRAVALGTCLPSVPSAHLWPQPGTMPDPETAARWSRELPEAWAATVDLARRCTKDWDFARPLLPVVSASPREAGQRLRDLAWEGAVRRYPPHQLGEARERLERELALITSRGLADYFLLVHRMVQAAGASAVCGRGSGASSVVAYCLGLTGVDPLAANLYFERFLGPGRTDIPDLDLDFPWDERREVLRRVWAALPPGSVSLVGSHVTFGRRAAFREAGRVLGLSEDLIGTLWELAQRNPSAPQVARLQRMASLVEGLPRHLSRHCGGVVVVPQGVDQVVPCEPTPDGFTVIQWDKDQAEEAGLVKIDLLGNRSLSVVRDALAWARDQGATLQEPWRPWEDEATQSLLASGRTMGIFYVESPAMRQLQAKAKRGTFSHVVVHSSLIRPAANRWICEYLRRLHGGSYEPLHPFLEDLLAESHGILCYQEDVMRVAVELAGFDHGLADQLRRTLAGKRGLPLSQLEARFKAGLRAHHLTPAQAETLWSMVESFAGYSFCKAHSASYALVSFQAAYLKAHHPQAFMASVLAHGGGYYSSQAYVSEARRMGLVVHGPDVNLSQVHWVPTPDGIRVGLAAVKGMSPGAAARLVEARQEGEFASMEDVVARVRLPLQALRGLVMAGAFDSLHGSGSRARLLHRLATGGAQPWLPAPARAGGQLPPWVLRLQELEALGFTLDGHPLDLVRHRPPDDSTCLPSRVGKRVRLLGWWITSKPVETSTGEAMAFVSFEDWYDIFETVVFPQVYARVRHHLGRPGPFQVWGTVSEHFGVHTLEVEGLNPLPMPRWTTAAREGSAWPIAS